MLAIMINLSWLETTKPYSHQSPDTKFESFVGPVCCSFHCEKSQTNNFILYVGVPWQVAPPPPYPIVMISNYGQFLSH